MLTVIVAGSAAGCGPDSGAYLDLQNAMKSHLTNVDHRPVASVSCTLHVHDTMRGDTARLRCSVVFEDGMSYLLSCAVLRPLGRR